MAVDRQAKLESAEATMPKDDRVAHPPSLLKPLLALAQPCGWFRITAPSTTATVIATASTASETAGK